MATFYPIAWYTVTVHLGEHLEVYANRQRGEGHQDLLPTEIAQSLINAITPYCDAARVYIEKGINYHAHIIFRGYDVRSTNAELQHWCWQKQEWWKIDHPDKKDWLHAISVQPKRKRNGTWAQVNLKEFIEKYFKKKRAIKGPELEGTPSKWTTGLLDGPVDYNMPADTDREVEEVDGPPAKKGKLMDGLTGQAMEYKQYKEYCVDKGITTVYMLKRDQKGKTLYDNKMCQPGGSKWLQDLMSEIQYEASMNHDLGWYAEKHSQGEPVATPDNWVTRLMIEQGINPDAFCGMLNKWMNKKSGKKNTLVITGPASTGKTMLASAINMVSPSTGMVNKNNENFPYCACENKTLIWQEEGKLTTKTVEEFKCIAGGTAIQLDKKGSNAQFTCYRTPLMWTTNSNPLLVYNGNMIDNSHTETLGSRYIMLKMDKNIDKWIKEHGYPTEDQMREGIGQCTMWGNFVTYTNEKQFKDPYTKPLVVWQVWTKEKPLLHSG